MAIVLQDDRLLPWRTAIQNVELGVEMLEIPAAERRATARLWLTKLPDGQITSDYQKSKSTPSQENKSLNTSGKSLVVIRPSHPTRGVAHVTNARWDAMDATASGAQGIAGRIELRERSAGVQTDGA
jgi:hypothetical protein